MNASEASSDVLPIVEACEVVGGQAEMARRLKVTPAAVNQWCKGIRPVPAERCPEIERETSTKGRAVACERLRPDIEWNVLRATHLAAEAPVHPLRRASDQAEG